MLSVDFGAMVAAMNALPPEAMWIVMVLSAFAATLAMTRFFGALGLSVMVVVGVIGANIQVVKLVQFGVFADPVALGTVLFSMTYLSTDILSEYYGKAAARRAVWLGFAGYLVFVLFNMATLGFAPLTEAQAGDAYGWALGTQGAMETLFLPQPVFFIAAMAAYLVSQNWDVFVFSRLRRATGGRMLWLRNNLSTASSALIDNIVFSALAFYLLAPDPVPFDALVFTFILGTYALRLTVALLDTPVVYAARFALPPEDRDAYERGAPHASVGALSPA